VDLQDALRARIYNGQFRARADLKKPRLADDKDAFPQLLLNNKDGAMFLIIGDTTGRGDGPSKTNYQYTAPFAVFQRPKLDAVCPYRKHFVTGRFGKCFCHGGRGEGGGEAYVWRVDNWNWAWPPSVITHNLLCFDVFCFVQYVVRT
jgi:hypothetical protein